MKKCLRCGVEFESRSGMHKYCSRKCTSRNYYDKNKELLIRKSMEYDDKHPEQVKLRQKRKMKKYIEDGRMKKAMRKYYDKNKDKWKSRCTTNYILNGTHCYNKYNPLNKECECGSKGDLEIHHEEYPIGKEKIIKAIDNGKIYYMCRKCHKHKDTHK